MKIVIAQISHAVRGDGELPIRRYAVGNCKALVCTILAIQVANANAHGKRRTGNNSARGHCLTRLKLSNHERKSASLLTEGCSHTQATHKGGPPRCNRFVRRCGIIAPVFADQL
jgi:hypothetical protein